MTHILPLGQQLSKCRRRFLQNKMSSQGKLFRQKSRSLVLLAMGDTQLCLFLPFLCLCLGLKGLNFHNQLPPTQNCFVCILHLHLINITNKHHSPVSPHICICILAFTNAPRNFCCNFQIILLKTELLSFQQQIYLFFKGIDCVFIICYFQKTRNQEDSDEQISLDRETAANFSLVSRSAFEVKLNLLPIGIYILCFDSKLSQ